jgi:hypothetical protein
MKCRSGVGLKKEWQSSDVKKKQEIDANGRRGVGEIKNTIVRIKNWDGIN